MKVAILAPFRPGAEDRLKLWSFAKTWWLNDYPDWPIYEGTGPMVGPFCRSAAINEAASKAGDWDVAVIIDTDTLCDPNAVKAAVEVAAATGGMALAGDERVMLSRQGTAKIMGGYKGNWRVRGIQERVYTDGCSCCVVVPRALWDAVGGFDEFFKGWGYEDIAFRIACEGLSGKPMVKLSSAMFHLWHTTSHENNPRTDTYKANSQRCERYKAAQGDREAIALLLAESTEEPAPVVELGPTRIPRILHRTVPADTSEQVEHWWTHLQQLHPGWEYRTYREPIDPEDWPLTGDLWDKCANGAQKAGLIRLEALVRDGGIYIDSDCQPYQSLEPLLHLPAFAAWEDSKCVPDAVLGAEQGHPAFLLMIEKARAAIQAGGDAWHSGPGVTTEVLPGRSDCLLLPPGAFYPHHYLQKNGHDSDQGGWVFLRHHWAGSWLSATQRHEHKRRQVR